MEGGARPDLRLLPEQSLPFRKEERKRITARWIELEFGLELPFIVEQSVFTYPAVDLVTLSLLKKTQKEKE